MKAENQLRIRNPQDEPRFVVGMDAHSKQLTLSIWDWSDRFNAKLVRDIRCVNIDAMVKTYERYVNLDSITIIEASNNSMALKRMLNEADYRAELVRSDTISGIERKRKVCDVSDARKLAIAYIKGDIREFVWTPSKKYDGYRDLLFAYRDTSKELTRISNRIWTLCSRKGYSLPVRGDPQKTETLRIMIAVANISGFARQQLDMLLDDYDRMLERKQALSQQIAETVLENPNMIRLLQLEGINVKGAFALVASVEDINRFSSASKLAAYGGFAPILDTSGDEELLAKRRGGTRKPLDGEGRQDIKFFFVEAGQSVLTSCARTKIGKWGWAMLNRGKPRNKVVCAIGRKLITYAFHILRNDPIPSRDGEEFFKRKMVSLYRAVGTTRMRELGYESSRIFALMQAEKLFGAKEQFSALKSQI